MLYWLPFVSKEQALTEHKSIYPFKGLWQRRHISSDVPASANERLVAEVQVFAFLEVRSDSARPVKGYGPASLSICVATNVAHLSIFSNQRWDWLVG
jgi:hypothetical protein